MRIHHCFVILAFQFLQLIATGQSSFRELNDEAITAFQQKNYQTAIANWTQIKRAGYTDPDLLYNIGLAESMSGNLPSALLNFEKAIRYKPADPEIQSAMQQERSRIQNSVIAVKPFFLVEWYKIFVSIFRPGVWALLAFAFMLFAVVWWFVELGIIKWRKQKMSRKIWLPVCTGIVLLLLSVLSYHEIHRINEGILFSDCGLNKGASEQSPLTRTLSPGEKVKVVDKIGGWYNVKLLNLDEGWVKKECVKMIDVDEEI